jgi:hypothetical protein
MRTKSINLVPTVRTRIERTLPRGSGFLIAGALSLMIWGMIAAVAAIV